MSINQYLLCVFDLLWLSTQLFKQHIKTAHRSLQSARQSLQQAWTGLFDMWSDQEDFDIQKKFPTNVLAMKMFFPANKLIQGTSDDAMKMSLSRLLLLMSGH